MATQHFVRPLPRSVGDRTQISLFVPPPPPRADGDGEPPDGPPTLGRSTD